MCTIYINRIFILLRYGFHTSFFNTWASSVLFFTSSSITKSISPVPVTENGSLTYTFLIQNEGNVPANEATAVIVTDTFNPILSNLTVTFNGSTWTEGEDYTYDKTTGTFATGAGKVTVPAATFTVNETTGEWSSNPGFSTLTITGTV